MAPQAPDAIPRPVLLAAGALVAFSIAATGLARWLQAPAAEANPPGETVRALRFVDQPGGYVDVADAKTGAAITRLVPGEDGFVRSTLRSLVRERRLQGLGDGPPFEVRLDANHRVVLADPATGRRIPLDAFGPTNAAAFARFLQAPATSPPREAPWTTR